MNCGDPHDAACLEVLDQMYAYLDGEVDEVARTAILRHLDECAPCLRQVGLERAVKALVQRSCTGHAAPEQLRVQIVTRIRQIRVTYGE